MQGLEDENLRLRRENKQLHQELDRVEYKYNKLKSEYIALMKRSVQFEIQLQKHQRIISTYNIQFEPEESSDEEIIELKQQDSFTVQNGQVTRGSDAPSKPRTSSESKSLRKSQVGDGQRLFEAFFVLEPYGDLHYEMKYCYPDKPQLMNFEALRNRLDRFIFPDGVELQLLEDDEEESRRNEVLFGSLGFDLLFILENDKPYRAVPALHKLNPAGRFYCYVFLRPSIMNTGNKSLLEGEMACCFITRWPLREFFSDLNRSMQQTLKLRYIGHEQDSKLVTQDYNIFTRVLQDVYDTKVALFPLHKTWRMENSELELSVDSQEMLEEREREFAVGYCKKLSALALSQLLHYTLVESHILFFAPDKKLLNDMFQFVRVLIRPLIWPFPIIYSLGEQLLLMLQSPVPVLIGALKSRQQLEQNSWDLSEVTVMDLTDMRFTQLQQQLRSLDPSVVQLAKHFEIDQNRLPAAEWFVRSKLNFVGTGVTPSELSAFDEQFKETQVVEQYKLLMQP